MKRLALFFLLFAAPAFGAQLMPLPKFQGIDKSGAGLAGGKVYAYQAGTTTVKATYTDSTGGTPNDWPVVLDSSGRASIWLSGIYKLKVFGADDVLVYEADFLNADTTDTTATSIQGLASSFCTGTGGTDTYACDLTPDGDYVDGMFVRFRANVGNTDAAAVNVDAGGDKAIRKKFDQVLVTGDLSAGEIVSVVYDDTAGYFQLVGNGIVSGDTDTLDGLDSTDLTDVGNWTGGTVPNARMPIRTAFCIQAGSDGTGSCYNELPGTVLARSDVGVYTMTIDADANAQCVCGITINTASIANITCGMAGGGTQLVVRTFQSGAPADLSHTMACFTTP